MEFKEFAQKKLEEIIDNAFLFEDWASYLINCAKHDAEENPSRIKAIKTRDGKEDYLIRYYYQDGRPDYRVTIHNTLLSDESGLHDHPWDWASLILKGGYWENTPEGRFWRGAGDFRIRTANDYHRLEIDPEKAGGETWSLFIMGKKFKHWGFLNEFDRWEQWQHYLYRKSNVWYDEEDGLPIPDDIPRDAIVARV